MPRSLEFYVIQTVAILLTAFFVPRLQIKGPLSGLIAVVLITIVNATIWDAALFFAIPDSLGAHSLVLFLANGTLFFVMAKTVPGIEVQGVLPALVAPIVFSLTTLVLQRYAQDVDWMKLLTQGVDGVQQLRDNLKTAPR